MNSITKIQFSACYEQAKLVYEEKKSQADAVKFLSDKNGLNKNSAGCYINAYKCMQNGSCYKKTIKEDATQYYLENIFHENGKKALELALQSLQKHMDYYSMQGKGNLKSLKEIHDKFKLYLNEGI